MTSVGFNLTSASSASMLDTSSKALERVRQTASVRDAAAPAKTGAPTTPESNTAYWSIPTTFSASSLSLGSVQDANGRAAAVTDTAAVGLEQATEIVGRIQQKLVQAKAVGANKSAINAEIDTMKARLSEVIDDSAFNGENWLQVGAGQQPKVASLLASVSTGDQGELSINMIDFDTAQATLVSKEKADDGLLTRAYAGTSMSGVPYDYYLMDANSSVPNRSSAQEVRIDAGTSSDQIDGMISALNRVLIDMVGASAEVSAVRNQISGDDGFIEGLARAGDLGTESRVRSDLGDHDAKRMAVEAQSQLQESGLNITNASMAGWLKIYP
ncbi:flagellar hook associated protein [Rhizobium glycinendophyticum]|uniref:Flagellar hook associated protein n=1 Tax=Rhizobium glycinendophyticum TaxID=2589807 RepID=A0A504UD32_9HYPH|nr:flagellar hook associated protein [Rhizobium glycinendophyticum]TPP11627.1 flagellar hook associated protein [Rhizobium glycinendophyticum]